MEGSAFNPNFRQDVYPSERSYDFTILASGAVVTIGALISIYALTVSGAPDPVEIAAMVYFP